ncbi:MAG: RidA family protein [Thiohalomonadales bacterium]
MKIEKYASGVEWEAIVGYSRAVRLGDMIEVSGTVATNSSGQLIGVGDPYQQTIQAIKNIQIALQHFNADLHNVYRTRIYVTNMDHWQEIGKAHNKFFADIRPVTTMLQISRFISSDMLVEIEAQARAAATS